MADYSWLPETIYDCYNSDKKRNYIWSLEKRDVQYESLHSYISPFLALAQYEEYYKSDILDMSKNKIVTIFEMVIKSYGMYSNYCSVLKDYFNYYNKDFEKVRPLFEDLDIAGNMENRYVKDYDMLLKVLNEAFPLTGGSLDEFRKLIVMLCFLGFKKTEVREMKKSDINFIYNSITHGGRTIEDIPESCMRLCEICMDMKEVYLNNTSHLPYNKRTFFPLCDNDFLIRTRFLNPTTQNYPVRVAFVDRGLASMNEVVNGDYSFETIRASGLYAWLYRKELAGDFNPNQSRRSLEKVYEQYFKIKCSGSNLSKNYALWKQIFYGN